MSDLSHRLLCATRNACAHVKDAFTAHPAQNGETYFEHARASLRIALAMFLGGWCAMIHAVFPFLAQRTASTIARAVVDSVSARRGDREISVGMPLRGSRGSRSASDVGRVSRGCGCATRL